MFVLRCFDFSSIYFNNSVINLNGKPLYFPSIPKETSRHLRHLLLGLLKRNHKERISFGKSLPSQIQNPVSEPFDFKSFFYIYMCFTCADEFFHHPFLEASSSSKKCMYYFLVYLSIYLCINIGAIASLLTQQLILTGSPAPMFSCPISGLGSSSSSSSTSQMASPQVHTAFSCGLIEQNQLG